jgi:hypothetical protein
MMTRVPTFALSNTLFILVIASVLAVPFPVAAHQSPFTPLPCEERALQELFQGHVACNLDQLCTQSACWLYRDARDQVIALGCDKKFDPNIGNCLTAQRELERYWAQCADYLKKECMDE